MGKQAEDRGDDLTDITPDAALATDLGDEKERTEQQLQYYGGDPIEDDDDLSTLDRGDSILPEEDDAEATKEEQTSEDEDESDADSEDDQSADASDDEADSEQDDAADDQSDAVDGDDDDDDAAEDDDSGESEDSSRDNQRVPLSRFNEVNERRKAAEKRLSELENTEQAVEEAAVEQYDYDAKEDEYMDLLLDGKTAEAKAIRREIRAAEKAEFEAAAKQTSSQTVSEHDQQRELKMLTSQATEMYPVLDENSADFNDAVATKTVTFMRGYVSSGLDPADAFVAALSDAIDLFDLDNRATEQPSDDDEVTTPKVTKKKPIKKVKEKTKVAQQQAQSPAAGGRGSAEAGAAVPDIDKLTDAELDALPAETKARLRGDFVD